MGVILYEMLTASLPYAASNVYNMMRAKTNEDPQPLIRHRPDLDPRLQEIVLHAIERLVKNRYASAAQMLEDLRDPSHVMVTERAHKLHPRSLRAQKIRRAAAIAAFFASLIGFFVFLIWLANRYPASSGQPHRSYRGEVR